MISESVGVGRENKSTQALSLTLSLIYDALYSLDFHYWTIGTERN